MKRSSVLIVTGAIVAVVGIIFVRYLFPTYIIPTPSCEKTLLVGDWLIVKRFLFSKEPSRNQFISFHYPMEDTALGSDQGISYYDLMRRASYEAKQYGLTEEEARQSIIEQYGGIQIRDISHRSIYLKRCVGLPGDTISIRDGVLFVNGQKAYEPLKKYMPYKVTFDKSVFLQERQLADYDAEVMSDLNDNTYMLRLTTEGANRLKSLSLVKKIEPFHYENGQVVDPAGMVFPNDLKRYNWNIDNFGPVVIPKKGMKILLSDSLLSQYRRLIEVYEGNKLEVLDGVCLIDGKEVSEYVCKQNYYWMLGDNWTNSLDSRYWGFVPEDHLIGNALFVLMSFDKKNGGIRPDRFFMNIDGK